LACDLVFFDNLSLRCLTRVEIEGTKVGIFKKIRKPSIAEQLGKEAGELALNQVKTPFVLTDYLKDAVFNPPHGFFDDLYIKGYCTSFITTMADVGSVTRGRQWSQTEKQSFIISAFTSLVGVSNISSFMTGARENALDAIHQLGTLHANIQIKLLYAPNSLDLTEPIYADAIELSESSDLYDLGTAFNKLTMCQYIESEYLN